MHTSWPQILHVWWGCCITSRLPCKQVLSQDDANSSHLLGLLGRFNEYVKMPDIVHN